MHNTQYCLLCIYHTQGVHTMKYNSPFPAAHVNIMFYSIMTTAAMLYHKPHQQNQALRIISEEIYLEKATPSNNTPGEVIWQLAFDPMVTTLTKRKSFDVVNKGIANIMLADPSMYDTLVNDKDIVITCSDGKEFAVEFSEGYKRDNFKIDRKVRVIEVA